MFLKKVVVTSLVGCITLMFAACGNDAEDACETLKDLCKSNAQIGAAIQAQDCSKGSDNYDKLSDAEKEKADKQFDCIDDADNCEAAIKCASDG